MIRLYSSQDEPTLLELLRLNMPQYFAASEEKDFIAYLNQAADNYFVVEENSKVIGSGGINYFYKEQLARISWDLVHPDFQRKGIGKQLTLYRINIIKQDPNIKLIVVRTTQMAYQFYQKLGFELEKTVKDFWVKGFDLYQMKLDLKNPAKISELNLPVNSI